MSLKNGIVAEKCCCTSAAGLESVVSEEALHVWGKLMTHATYDGNTVT